MEVERIRAPLQGLTHMSPIDPSPYAAPSVSFDSLRKSRLQKESSLIHHIITPPKPRKAQIRGSSDRGVENEAVHSDSDSDRGQNGRDVQHGRGKVASAPGWQPAQSAEFNRELERRGQDFKRIARNASRQRSSNDSPRDTLYGEVVRRVEADSNSEGDVVQVKAPAERIQSRRRTQRDIRREIVALEEEKRQLQQERLLQEQGNPGYRDAREYIRSAREPAARARPVMIRTRSPEDIRIRQRRERPRAQREVIEIRDMPPPPSMRRSETMPYPRGQLYEEDVNYRSGREEVSIRERGSKVRPDPYVEAAMRGRSIPIHRRYDAPSRYELEEAAARSRERERFDRYEDARRNDRARSSRQKEYYVGPSRGRPPPGAKKLYSVTAGEAHVVGEMAAGQSQLSNWNAAMPVISSTISQDQTKSSEEQQRALLKRVLI